MIAHKRIASRISARRSVNEALINLTRPQALLVMAVGLLPATAFAYLDPGTGSMILQGIIAAVAIAGLTIRSFWYQILGLFGKKPPTTEPLDAERQDRQDDKKTL